MRIATSLARIALQVKLCTGSYGTYVSGIDSTGSSYMSTSYCVQKIKAQPGPQPHCRGVGVWGRRKMEAPWAHLVVHDAERTTLALQGDHILIGRSRDCDIVLKGASCISRYHFELKRNECGDVDVTQLGRRKSFLNGFLLEPKIPARLKRDIDNAPYQRPGCMPDDPLISISVPNCERSADRAGLCMSICLGIRHPCDVRQRSAQLKRREIHCFSNEPAPKRSCSPTEIPAASLSNAPARMRDSTVRLDGLFAGILAIVPKRGTLVGVKSHALIVSVLLQHCGKLVDDPSRATHILLDAQFEPADIVDGLAGLPRKDWPAIHTPDWLPACSRGKLLYLDKFRHPCELSDEPLKQAPSVPVGDMDAVTSVELVSSQHESPSVNHKDCGDQDNQGVSELPRRLALGSIEGCLPGEGPCSCDECIISSNPVVSTTKFAIRPRACEVADSSAHILETSDAQANEPTRSNGERALIPLPDLSRNQWASRNKGKWQCQVTAPAAPGANLELADQLDELANWYKDVGGDEWRYFSFSRQAKTIRSLEFEVTSASQLESRRGFGRKSLQKIEELLATGKLRRLQSLKSTDRSQAIGELTKIHGVGSKTAASWFAKGISTIEEASTAGIMNHTQRTGARFYQDLEHRIPREEVAAIIDAVRAAMHAALKGRGVSAGVQEQTAVATGAGSYRRGKPSSGDVDVLLCRRDGGDTSGVIEDVLLQLRHAGCVVEHLTHEDEVQRHGLGNLTSCGTCSSYRGIVRLPGYPLHRRLDLKIYPPEQYAYALLYFTGSDHFNRSMRHYAKTLGYSLSDHGIVHVVKAPGSKQNLLRGTRNLVPAKTEADIFAALGLQFVEPALRNTEVTPIAGIGESSSVPKISANGDLALLQCT